jgi:hypothetical protein
MTPSANFSSIATLPTDIPLDVFEQGELKPLIFPSKHYLFPL